MRVKTIYSYCAARIVAVTGLDYLIVRRTSQKSATTTVIWPEGPKNVESLLRLFLLQTRDSG